MEVSCPVSAERVNENVVRLVASFVATIGMFCICVGNYWGICFLVIDFAVRGFGNGKWSLLKWMAIKIDKGLSLTVKQTDLAPKKFAAKLGFFFCLAIVLLSLFDQWMLSFIFTSFLISLALLESVLAICVGCHVYTIYHKISQER